jgi:choline dehydrogenase-like flavoprotein
MMPREIGGVVDHKLRLFGCPNLRVCDASVMAIGPGVAFKTAIAGVAEMGAAFVKQSLSRKE